MNPNEVRCGRCSRCSRCTWHNYCESGHTGHVRLFCCTAALEPRQNSCMHDLCHNVWPLPPSFFLEFIFNISLRDRPLLVVGLVNLPAPALMQRSKDLQHHATPTRALRNLRGYLGLVLNLPHGEDQHVGERFVRERVKMQLLLHQRPLEDILGLLQVTCRNKLLAFQIFLRCSSIWDLRDLADLALSSWNLSLRTRSGRTWTTGKASTRSPRL